MISIFGQGLFHSFIDIYFPIWINHFINERYKLLSLSLSRTSSLFGNLIGIMIARDNFSFQRCYIILSISIFIVDLIFIFTVTKHIKSADDYFNL